MYKTKNIYSTKATLHLKPKRIYIIGYMVVGGRIANQWKVGNESTNSNSWSTMMYDLLKANIESKY